jgi:carbon monoxide dehydrogenase subunit G
MPSATASIHIDAPPEECFDFLREPDNHTLIVPGLRSIEAEPREEGGYEGEFTYAIAGIPLELRFRDVELDPPHRRVFEVSGPMEGTATYELAAEDGGTRFEFENAYEMPGPEVLGSVAGPIVKRYLKSDAESWVANAKAAIESR